MRLSVYGTALLVLGTSVAAREITPRVQEFYDKIRNQGKCNKPLKSGFYSYLGGSNCEYIRRHNS